MSHPVEITYISVSNTSRVVFVYSNGKQYTARNVEPESLGKYLNEHNQPVIAYQQRKVLPSEEFDIQFRGIEDNSVILNNRFKVAQGIWATLVSYAADSETGETEFDLFYEIESNSAHLDWVIETLAGEQHVAAVIDARRAISPHYLADVLHLFA